MSAYFAAQLALHAPSLKHTLGTRTVHRRTLRLMAAFKHGSWEVMRRIDEGEGGVSSFEEDPQFSAIDERGGHSWKKHKNREQHSQNGVLTSVVQQKIHLQR